MAALRTKIIEILKNLPGNGAEIGVLEGEFSELLLSQTKAKKIYMVDAWRLFPSADYPDVANLEDSHHSLNMYSATNATNKFKERRCIINELSTEAAKIFPDEFFDWVYIDANHTTEAVKADIAAWLPKVKKGGIICGDDFMDVVYEHAVFGVVTAVKSFFDEGEINVLRPDDPNVGQLEMPQWWVRKK